MLFASDYPYPGGIEKGDLALARVIKPVELMDISEAEKDKIFTENARKLLHL
jgi:predicted TIM-barrel fold metal-dependent hydrolase